MKHTGFLDDCFLKWKILVYLPKLRIVENILQDSIQKDIFINKKYINN